ncbi:hypothetical protein HMPREF1979_00950 [Actinomyces johnsonii F0542]|uniref:Uncharacterized protein n=1 Tax=Actinomyces johnsonii F0542 TaxID=1321818 RepID=U1QSM5_9ACTO|nr:hypothetical protein HMPREF1979_00950 [Actinomyces johnsonii F0542]
MNHPHRSVTLRISPSASQPQALWRSPTPGPGGTGHTAAI